MECTPLLVRHHMSLTTPLDIGSLVARHGHVVRPEPGTGYGTISPVSSDYGIHSAHARCRIQVHFKDSKGNLVKTVEANEGDDLLSIAHEYDIDLEGTFIETLFKS